LRVELVKRDARNQPAHISIYINLWMDIQSAAGAAALLVPGTRESATTLGVSAQTRASCHVGASSTRKRSVDDALARVASDRG
jgi:hypothetical protein